MKLSYLLIIILVVAIVGFIFYSLRGGQTEEGYAITIQKARDEKDVFMKGNESPFTDSTETFTGLKYFPPDTKYRIISDLEPIRNKKMVVLTTSDGKEQKYLEHSYAMFNLDGLENKLLLLEIMDMGPLRGKLFLAFADATSAKETYGAGRYLDVKKVPGATSITLDFNEAYNPYCAYSDAFSCPFPPKENILKVAINAGEKTYH
ncbi:MAG: DUF1684 domain-containing protein [Bacteroidia bacterium]|nr:DUF1684 domain-containing protein [Bacteroidia bacterium]